MDSRWRAVSILLAILHHSQIQFKAPVLEALLQSISNAGEAGVELFFAISGLLICSRLLEEEAIRADQREKLLPAAMLSYSASGNLLSVGDCDPGGVSLDSAVANVLVGPVFFRNYAMVFEYMHHSPLPLHWYTGHFWSLSIEEHFCLVLPGVLVFCGSSSFWAPTL